MEKTSKRKSFFLPLLTLCVIVTLFAGPMITASASVGLAGVTPQIGVGEQMEIVTCKTAVTNCEVFAVTARGFSDPAYSGSIAWKTTSHNGITLTLNSDGSKVLVTTTAAAEPGKYEFKVISGEVKSADVILEIAKLSKMDDLVSREDYILSTGVTDREYDLSTLIEAGGSVPQGSEDLEEYIEGFIIDASIEGTVLTYSAASAELGTNAYLRIPVTGCTYYEDYDIELMITSTDNLKTVPVNIDGAIYYIGTATTVGGVTTVEIDQEELKKQLETASDSFIIPIVREPDIDTFVAQLVVANVEEMAEKDMTLSVQMDKISFNIPAVSIDTDALLTELGATDPTKAPVNVTIKELSEDDVTLENGELLLPPVEFTVTAPYPGKSVVVEVFGDYVQRVIKVPGNIDAGRITTAVVVEEDKQRHVPTEVFQKDGKWYARINSLTNSTYALIENEVSFADAEGKWFESVVNEIASRGVMNGRSEGVFDGEAAISRAEFAAILIRGLGLPEDGDASVFTDISTTAWYYGAVGKAYEYELIKGYGNGVFDPEACITREEAMMMVKRAAAITAFAGSVGALEGFTDADAISDWALEAVQWNVGSDLIKGRTDTMLCGQDSITRGESATVILRLLQKSNLVSVKTQV